MTTTPDPSPGPTLASPKRLAIAAVPVLGFLSTPLLPFVNGPYLWLGIPSVMVWTALWVVGTVVALRVVEHTYLREGGREADRAELAETEVPARTAQATDGGTEGSR